MSNKPTCFNCEDFERMQELYEQEAADKRALLEENERMKEENRWIPVTEKTPELIPCNAGTAYSEAVVTLTSNRKIVAAVFDGTQFFGAYNYWECEPNEIVTHWKSVLPLPEYKEEQHEA